MAEQLVVNPNHKKTVDTDEGEEFGLDMIRNLTRTSVLVYQVRKRLFSIHCHSHTAKEVSSCVTQSLSRVNS